MHVRGTSLVLLAASASASAILCLLEAVLWWFVAWSHKMHNADNITCTVVVRSVVA